MTTITRLLSVETVAAGAMDGTAATARVEHDFSEGLVAIDVVQFVQPTGPCGPVFVLVGTEWVRIEDMRRFGETLTVAWVEAFYADVL